MDGSSDDAVAFSDPNQRHLVAEVCLKVTYRAASRSLLIILFSIMCCRNASFHKISPFTDGLYIYSTIY